MKNTHIMLEAKRFLSSAFTDYRFEAADLTQDEITLPSLTAATDYMYLGYRKPIHAFYTEIKTANGDGTPALTLEYWDGSSWSAVSGIVDDSKGFSRSGFIQWDQPSDWESTTVDSTTKYWLRISLNTDAGCEVYGFSMVFSDDRSVKTEYPIITDSDFKLGESSLIHSHVAARNWIIEKLNDKGITVKEDDTGETRAVNVFDLLEEEQLRQAGTFYALYKILDNASDEAEDQYHRKALSYLGKAKSAVNKFNITVDVDDDGERDPAERKIKMSWGQVYR